MRAPVEPVGKGKPVPVGNIPGGVTPEGKIPDGKAGEEVGKTNVEELEEAAVERIEAAAKDDETATNVEEEGMSSSEDDGNAAKLEVAGAGVEVVFVPLNWAAKHCETRGWSTHPADALPVGVRERT